MSKNITNPTTSTLSQASTVLRTAALLCVLASGIGAAAASADPLASFDDRTEAAFATACKTPGLALVLPDGGQAGRDDMLDAMRAVKQLDADSTAYSECLRQRMTAMKGEAGATPVQQAAVERIGSGLINDAVDRAEWIATAFNEELRKFKARPQDAVGKRFVPARMNGELDLSGCVTPQIAGLTGNFRMRLSVDPSGAATVEELTPLAAATSLFGLAACASGKLAFTPATRDGKAVTSEFWIPFRLSAYAGQADSDLTQPTLASTPQDFLAATNECYPQEARAAAAEGMVKMKILLSSGGFVRKPVVAEGSGNAVLDETARCIVRRLRFTPVMIDDQPQDAEITWTVPVKTPEAWLAPKP